MIVSAGGKGPEVVDTECPHRGGDCWENVFDQREARHDEHENGQSRTQEAGTHRRDQEESQRGGDQV